jgi:hypothetical protein
MPLLAICLIAMVLAAAWIGGEAALIVDRRLRKRRAARRLAGDIARFHEIDEGAVLIGSPPPEPAPATPRGLAVRCLQCGTTSLARPPFLPSSVQCCYCGAPMLVDEPGGMHSDCEILGWADGSPAPAPPADPAPPPDAASPPQAAGLGMQPPLSPCGQFAEALAAAIAGTGKQVAIDPPIKAGPTAAIYPGLQSTWTRRSVIDRDLHCLN